MADRGQWRGAFFVLGAVGVLYALPYFMFLRGVNEDAPSELAKAGAALALGALVKVRTFLLRTWGRLIELLPEEDLPDFRKEAIALQTRAAEQHRELLALERR